MNRIQSARRIVRGALPATIAAALLLHLTARPLRAQVDYQRKFPTIAWANTFYGPDNVGLGIGVRSGLLGIGTTIYGLSLDTVKSKASQSGVIGISTSLYLVFDPSEWLALSAHIGGGGHFITYGTVSKSTRAHRHYGFVSTGGGFQVSLASRLILGIGYNVSFDPGDEDRDPAYNPIHSITTQVGYRL